MIEGNRKKERLTAIHVGGTGRVPLRNVTVEQRCLFKHYNKNQRKSQRREKNTK